MHKKLMMIALLGALSAAPVAAQTNVGVVDFEVVIQKSTKGKAFFEELNQFREAKKADLDARVAAYQEKQKDAQAKAASLSEDKKVALGQELQQMQTDLKRFQEDAERATQVKVKTGLDVIQKQLVPLVRQIALEKDLHLVLHYGQQSEIVFFHDKINITADVIKKYDESSN